MPKISRSPRPAGSPLQLTTLGAAEVTYVDAQKELRQLVGPGKQLALLAYAACSPARRTSRELLTDLLWPELEPEAARHALRQTVWTLRQRLGEEMVSTTGGAIRVSSALRSDRDRFLEAVQNVDLDASLALYQGHFLEGLGSVGSARFEQWVDSERYRLQLILRRAADVTIKQLLARGRAERAEVLARRMRGTDPEHVGTWRLLVESLLSAGDHVAAQVEARALQDFLRSGEPSDVDQATAVVIERAQRMGARAKSKPRDRLEAELVGREAEFGSIIEAWHQATGGRSRHIHITAPTGMGKTRLLEAVHHRLQATGCTSVFVRANRSGRSVPSGLAGELAGAVGALPGAMGISPRAAGALVSLQPRLSASYDAAPDLEEGPEALRFRALALIELVSTVCEEAPLALFIDDIDASDPASTSLIESLMGKLGNKALMLVTASRVASQSCVRASQTTDIELRALTEGEVRDLIRGFAALPDEPWAEELVRGLHRVAAGSPRIAQETLQMSLDSGALSRDDRWRCADPADLSRGLDRGGAVRRRLEGLEQPVLWLVNVLSEVDHPIGISQLAALATSPETAMADLALLEDRGLIQRSDAGWTLSPSVRRGLVREIAGHQMTGAIRTAVDRQAGVSGHRRTEVSMWPASTLIPGPAAQGRRRWLIGVGLVFLGMVLGFLAAVMLGPA